MSRFGSQYKIGRPTGRCAASGVELEPGAAIVATLCERVAEGEGEDGLERVDFSAEAWDEGERPDGLFSHWRTTVATGEEPRNAFVDDEVLVDLFHRLADDDREQRVAFRFVLTLILMRKRLVRFVGRARAEEGVAETWLVRMRGQDPDEPSLRVVNPQLADDDVRELTAQLGEILQGAL